MRQSRNDQNLDEDWKLTNVYLVRRNWTIHFVPKIKNWTKSNFWFLFPVEKYVFYCTMKQMCRYIFFCSTKWEHQPGWEHTKIFLKEKEKKSLRWNENQKIRFLCYQGAALNSKKIFCT